MVKTLFESQSEEVIQKQYRQESRRDLKGWLTRVVLLFLVILPLFIFLLDISIYHFDWQSILLARGIPFIIALTILLAILFIPDSKQFPWEIPMFLLEGSLLWMSILLILIHQDYQIYLSTSILLIAFCFVIHR